MSLLSMKDVSTGSASRCQSRRSCIVAFVIAVELLNFHVIARGEIIVRGWYNVSSVPIVQEIDAAYQKAHKDRSLTVDFDDRATFSGFATETKPFDVLITPAPAGEFYAKAMSFSFPMGTPQPEVFVVGQRKLAVAINPQNPIAILTRDQICKILSAENQQLDWDTLGGRHLPIRCFGESGKSWCRDIIESRCMRYYVQKPGYTEGREHPFRNDITECIDGDDVISKVSHDSSAIGFFQYRGQHFSGVKVIPIADKDGKPPVALREGSFVQDDYPLAEPILLYLHPKAPAAAKKFCEFAVGPEGTAVAAKYGVITPYAQAQAEADAREALVKEGHGPIIRVVGPASGKGIAEDVATAYVRAGTVARVQYGGLNDQTTMDAFLRGRDLLIMDCESALRLYDENRKPWDTLAGSVVDSVGNKVGISRYYLGSRAVGIAVNSLSKLRSLTSEQIRSAFATGKLPAATTAPLGTADVNCYGPDQPDPMFYAFYQKLEFRDAGRLQRKTDTAEVVRALSGDPAGIGFVNLAELPPDLSKAGIKLLAIGDPQNAVQPTDENILKGVYPLVQYWDVYVHPQANEDSRKFVQFMTAPDRCEDILRKNGLLPSQTPSDVNDPGKTR